MGCTKLIMQRNNFYLLYDLEYVEIEGVCLNHIHYQQFHKYSLLVYLNCTLHTLRELVTALKLLYGGTTKKL
mgnify:CR=1 FL=1